MTTKKLTRRQACWVEFLLRFNFVIFYITDKENQKADLPIRHLNDLPSDDNNDWQQHSLQTLLSTKRWEIVLIKREENITIIEKIIQANLEDNYCFKLYHLLKIGYPIKKIDLCHFLNLSVDSENCVCWYDQL